MPSSICGVRLASISSRPLLRWTLIVGTGESLGFAVPAAVGAIFVTSGASALVLYMAIVVAGACEGAVLGASQAYALRPHLPAVEGGRWVAYTALGAAGAWALGMLPSTLHDFGAPLAVTIATGIVAAPLLVLSLAGPQAHLLRNHLARAWRWVPINVLAWAVALPLTFIPGIFVGEDSSTATIVVAFGLGGVGMAFIAAAVTGAGLLWMLGGNPQADPADGSGT